MTSRGFTGPVAENYARFRRGYPPAVIDALVTALALDEGSRVLDLGCGTGQLTIPLAGRTRSVLGMDVEPDMLRLARRAAQDSGTDNTTWVLGADSDVGALLALLGEQALDAVTIAQALHWMDPPALFAVLRRLVRPRGSVAVIANGTPLWLQEAHWSRRLRGVLEAWLDTELTSWCGTDAASRRGYRDALAAAGFDRTADVTVEYTAELTVEQVVGNLYSAMTPDQLPRGEEREGFEERVRAALGEPSATGTFAEQVSVSVLIGAAP
jgi:ubiquinone/menaquinone biosynthesis C-methylase UbiE